MRWCFVGALCALLMAPSWGQEGGSPSEPKSDLKEQELQQLRARVAALEQLVKLLRAELETLKRNGAPPVAEPAAGTAVTQQAKDGTPQPLTEEERQQLEQELAKELAQPSLPSPQRPTPSYGAVVFGGGAWQALNPDTSVIANFRAAFRGKRPFAAFGGSEFSEAEIAFQAATDPFSRLDTFIAVGAHGTEIEEATLTVLDPSFLRLPRNLQLRLGKLLAPFGQLNTIHPPEQPFTDTPLVYRLWFGHEHGNGNANHEDENHEDEDHEGTEPIPTEGLFTGTGVALSWLLPMGRNVSWLTLAPLNVDNPTFRANSGRPVWLARWRTLQELSPTQTLGWGLSYAFGRNDLQKDTRLLGVDVTYRWRPLKEGLYRSLVWQTEAFWGWRETNNGTLKPKGWFTMVEYQLSRTLFLGARYEFAQAPDKRFSGRGFSLAITLFPSEFGRYRLQWSRLKIGGQTVHEIWLQTTFSIGVHRPHPL